MNNNILNIDKLYFGSDDAERDKKLDFLNKVFLQTSLYKRAMQGFSELIIGRKGTGKSAICLMLKDAFNKENNVSTLYITPKDFSASKLKKLKTEALDENNSYVLSWKYALLIKVALSILNTDADTIEKKQNHKDIKLIKRFLLENGEIQIPFHYKILNSIKNISRLSFKVPWLEGQIEAKSGSIQEELSSSLNKFENLVNNILTSIPGYKIVIFLDRIDEVWNRTAESKLIIIGIIKAVHELNSEFKAIHIILFLRSDIYDILNFDDGDKFRSLEERINWTPEDLKFMISTRGKISLGLTESDPNKLWDIIFSSRVGHQSSFEYIKDRTMNRPRELIQFCNHALKIAQDAGHNFITAEDILSSEKQYSEWKLNDLKSEYSVQYPFLDGLFGVFQGFKQKFLKDKFKSRYEEVKEKLERQHPDLESMTVNSILQTLYNISFLGTEIDNQEIYVNDSNLILAQQNIIVIHPSFHIVLGVRKYEIRISKDKNISIGQPSTVNIAGDIFNVGQAQTNIQTSANIDIKSDFFALLSDFDKLRDLIETLGDPILNRNIEKIGNLLVNLTPNSPKKDYSNSFRRLYRFLNDLNEENDKVNKLLKNSKYGYKTIHDIIKKYNNFALWLGIPQIPDLFFRK